MSLFYCNLLSSVSMFSWVCSSGIGSSFLMISGAGLRWTYVPLEDDWLIWWVTPLFKNVLGDWDYYRDLGLDMDGLFIDFVLLDFLSSVLALDTYCSLLNRWEMSWINVSTPFVSSIKLFGAYYGFWIWFTDVWTYYSYPSSSVCDSSGI
jgi:hypothetical protein